MKLLLCILSASVMWAQATFTLSGPPTIRGGTQNFVTVNLSLSGAATVAAYQFDVAWPTGWTVSKAEAGSATTAAGKILECRTDFTRCIASGLNSATISAGVLATFTVQAPASTPAGPGPSVNGSAILAATFDGMAAASAIGSPWVPSFFDRADVNGDLSVNILDVELLKPYILSPTPSACPVEQDDDGICTILDRQRVIKAVLGATP